MLAQAHRCTRIQVHMHTGIHAHGCTHTGIQVHTHMGTHAHRDTGMQLQTAVLKLGNETFAVVHPNKLGAEPWIH